MPHITRGTVLENDDGTPAGVVVLRTDDIEVLGTNGSRTHIKLTGPGTIGWVSSETVDVTDGPPSGPISKLVFARNCWRQALYFGLNAHYLAAAAEFLSGTADGTASGKTGPYRFTAAEWATGIADDEFKEVVQQGGAATPIYQASDIFNWRRQCAVFASMTSRAMDRLAARGNQDPTVVELFTETFPAAAAADLATNLTNALNTTRQFVIDAGADVLDDPPNNAEMLQDATKPAKKLSPSLTSGKFDEIAPRMMRKLMNDFQFTKEQSAGILGNIGHECAGFKLMQEVKPLGGGRGGLGMCQWTGPRRRTFEKFCSDNGVSTDNEDANYNFLKVELTGSERGAVTATKAAGTIGDAVRAFESHFERAGVKHYESRDKWAARALAAF